MSIVRKLIKFKITESITFSRRAFLKGDYVYIETVYGNKPHSVYLSDMTYATSIDKEDFYDLEKTYLEEVKDACELSMTKSEIVEFIEALSNASEDEQKKEWYGGLLEDFECAFTPYSKPTNNPIN